MNRFITKLITAVNNMTIIINGNINPVVIIIFYYIIIII